MDHGRAVQWLCVSRSANVRVVETVVAEGRIAQDLVGREDELAEGCHRSADGEAIYTYLGRGHAEWIAVVSDDPEPTATVLRSRVPCVGVDELLRRAASDRPGEHPAAIEALGRIGEPDDPRIRAALARHAAVHPERVRAAEAELARPRRFRRHRPSLTLVAADAHGAVFVDDLGRVMAHGEVPTVLTDDLASVSGLALAGEHIYVVSADPPTAARLLRIPRHGGVPTPVSEPLCHPGRLQIHDGVVHVAERGRIVRLGPDDRFETLAVADEIAAFTVDARALYFATEGGQLWVAPHGEPARASGALPWPVRELVSDGERVFAAGWETVARIEPTTGQCGSIAERCECAGLVVTGRHLLWEHAYDASYTDHFALCEADVDGSTYDTFAYDSHRRANRRRTPLSVPLAVGPGHLYWALGSEIECEPFESLF